MILGLLFAFVNTIFPTTPSYTKYYTYQNSFFVIQNCDHDEKSQKISLLYICEWWWHPTSQMQQEHYSLKRTVKRLLRYKYTQIHTFLLNGMFRTQCFKIKHKWFDNRFSVSHSQYFLETFFSLLYMRLLTRNGWRRRDLKLTITDILTHKFILLCCSPFGFGFSSDSIYCATARLFSWFDFPFSPSLAISQKTAHIILSRNVYLLSTVVNWKWNSYTIYSLRAMLWLNTHVASDSTSSVFISFG